MKIIEFSSLRKETMIRVMGSLGMDTRAIRRRMIRGIGELHPLIRHADSMWPSRAAWIDVIQEAQE